MPEELGWLEIGGGWEASEVSQEAIDRVRKNMWQSKKVGAQIKSLQHQNSQYATLLSLLLQWINDDQLLGHIFHQLVDYKIDPVIIFVQFLPIIERHIEVWGLETLYEDVWKEFTSYTSTISGVVEWMTAVRKRYESLYYIESDQYISFVKRRLEVEWIVDFSSLEQEKIKELDVLLQKEFAV